MSKYLLKKLGHQELAYRSGEPGKRGGQYFLIAKPYLDFFPPLSKEIPQDLEILNIVSHGSNMPAQAKYIYDNDKYHGSTAKTPRDEHRLNINLKINPNREIYLKDDIIIFREETFQNELGNEESAFIITRFRETENKDDYEKLENLISRKKLNHSSRNYAFAEEQDLQILVNHRERLFDRVMSEDFILPDVDKGLLKLRKIQPNLKANEPSSFENQIKRIVFDHYNYKCLVSKIGFKWKEPTGIKNSWRGITAAHIKPRAHGGEYTSQNIIPLIEPIHQLFDRGIFTITSDYKIELHEDALNDNLLSDFHKYHEMQLELPNGIEISEENLEHHRNEVYGNFITGEQIRSTLMSDY